MTLTNEGCTARTYRVQLQSGHNAQMAAWALEALLGDVKGDVDGVGRMIVSGLPPSRLGWRDCFPPVEHYDHEALHREALTVATNLLKRMLDDPEGRTVALDGMGKGTGASFLSDFKVRRGWDNTDNELFLVVSAGGRPRIAAAAARAVAEEYRLDPDARVTEMGRRAPTPPASPAP